ncbi:MAG TPA: glycosyltransferase family 4 protein, partial [Actinomycetota bacterium]|nr:glycosyltransferase family 4 protein [Actinomycetota bacterium]
RALRATIDVCRQFETDKVLFGTPWPLSLLGPRLKERGLRYAVMVHGAELLVPGAVPILRGRLAAALRKADLLLTVSEFTRNHVVRMTHGNGRSLAPLEAAEGLLPRVDVLSPRVDTQTFTPKVKSNLRARLGIGPETKVLLCFGRLVPRKGVDRVIALLPRLSSEFDVVLVVAGTGPEERKLRQLADRVRARAIFTGRVPHDDAPALYALADVFVLAVVDRWRGLDVEGLGVVLLEAAACGTPCVTGKSGGTSEAVIDGKTGFVVDAADSDQLYEAVHRLLSDPEQARAMGAAGRRFVIRRFARRPLPQSLLDWLDD